MELDRFVNAFLNYCEERAVFIDFGAYIGPTRPTRLFEQPEAARRLALVRVQYLNPPHAATRIECARRHGLHLVSGIHYDFLEPLDWHEP